MGKLVRITIVGVIVLAILMVFSSQGIRAMDKWARDRKDTTIGNTLPYNLAAISYYTLRYKLAEELYKKNLEMWPAHPKTPTAEFRIAKCEEKLGNYREAVGRYEAFALDHPDDSRADAARNLATKIKAVKLDQPFGD